MDDREYYTMMNRSNSALIIQQLQKDLQKKKKTSASQPSQSFTDLKVRQGKADAEMLYEKNDKDGV